MKGNEARSFAPIFILTLLNTTASSVLFTLISMYAAIYFEANTFEVGLLSSTSSLTTLILTMPSGVLSDRFGRKAVLILSLVANTLSFILFYYAAEFSMLMISVMLSGMAFATFGPTMQSLVADLATAATRRKSVGWYTIGTAIGMFVGPAICSILLQFVIMRDIFLIALGISSIELIIGILFVKEPSRNGGEVGLVRGNLGGVIWNRNVMCTSVAIASGFFVESSVMTFFPIIALNVYELAPQFISSILMIRSLASMFARTFVVIKMVGRFSEKRLLLVSLSLPLLLVLSLYLTGYMTLSILIVLTGAAIGVAYPMGAMIIAESTSSRERGLGNAVYIVGMNGGVTIGPTVMGMLANIIGIAMIFPLAAFVPLVGLVACSMIKMK